MADGNHNNSGPRSPGGGAGRVDYGRLVPPSFAEMGATPAPVDASFLAQSTPLPQSVGAVPGIVPAPLNLTETDVTPALPRDGLGQLPHLLFDEDAAPMARPDLRLDEANDDFHLLYARTLALLKESEDLGLDVIAKARIADLEATQTLPQLIIRQLTAGKLIDKRQLARAMARAQGRLEIMNYQDIPGSAHEMRKELDPRVQMLLRDRRMIPLRRRPGSLGEQELHLAHDEPTRDRVFEAALQDYLPATQFYWHYASREVCGQYWVTGDQSGVAVDEGLEAEALLDRIISDAIDARASDIHLDPNIKGEPKAIIKYRVDGQVRAKETITLEQLDRLRIRIENIARMAKVDLSHPNKGAFSREGYDWRVQVQPHAGRQGPTARIVIRRLMPEVMSMDRLGYPSDFTTRLIQAAKSPNGVIFWTGPTGSGKTESIHAAVVTANPMGRGLSVHTLEDPPEKRVEGYAVQMEIAETDKARTGLELLKSSLRADPDVIIVGEVRAPDMAKLVFDAANTGHLVFSTLHTNSSLDAIIRLDELGIHGFLVSYIRGIAAQRLLRRLCKHCQVPLERPDALTQKILDYYEIPATGRTFYTHNPKGCANCNFTGYKGRIAAAEWLEPSAEIINMCAKRDYTELESAARRAGWKPMGYMAAQHMCNGVTDAEELQGVILELSLLK